MSDPVTHGEREPQTCPTLQHGLGFAGAICGQLAVPSENLADDEAFGHSLLSMALLSQQGMASTVPTDDHPDPHAGTPAGLLAEFLIRVCGLCANQGLELGGMVAEALGYDLTDNPIPHFSTTDPVGGVLDEIAAGLRRTQDLSEFLDLPAPEHPQTEFTTLLHRHLSGLIEASSDGDSEQVGSDFVVTLIGVLDYGRICDLDVIDAFTRRLKTLIGDGPVRAAEHPRHPMH